MSEGSVEIKDLVKTYVDDRGRPTFTAVKGISLNIEDGEFMVLVGPSGCGKSTTLRMIAGLEKSYRWDNLNRRKGSKQSRTERTGNRDGLPELRALPSHDHLQKHGVRPSIGKEDERVHRGHGRTNRKSPPARSHDGTQAGGSFGRSAAACRSWTRHCAESQVFLFDEPLSNLDAKMRVQMRSEISRLHAQLGYDNDLRYPRPSRGDDHG